MKNLNRIFEEVLRESDLSPDDLLYIVKEDLMNAGLDPNECSVSKQSGKCLIAVWSDSCDEIRLWGTGLENLYDKWKTNKEKIIANVKMQ